MLPPESSDASKLPHAIQSRIYEDNVNVSSPLPSERCLIENVVLSDSVEYTRCLPEFTTSKVLDALEFSWNMPRYSLNVNARSNMIRLSPNMRKLFKSSRRLWILLPEVDIIDQYLDASTDRISGLGNAFPKIEGTVFRYKFIASPAMSSVPIHRQCPTEGPESASIPTADDFTYHSFPYDDLPTIVSHVHPRFVICHAGHVVSGAYTYYFARGDASLTESLVKITTIWRRWNSLVHKHKGWKEFLLTERPDNEVADRSSETTEKYRLYFLDKKPGRTSNARMLRNYAAHQEEEESSTSASEEERPEPEPQQPPIRSYTGGRALSDFSTCTELSK